MEKQGFIKGYEVAAEQVRQGRIDFNPERAWSNFLGEAGEDGSIRLTKLPATENDFQFKLIIRFKNEELISIIGFPRSLHSFGAQDFASAYEAERVIEKMIGVRVHIIQLPPEQ